MTRINHAPSPGQVGREALLYIPGKIVPAILAFVSIPIYTYFFSSDKPGFTVADYGRYDLTVNCILFAHMLTVVWLEIVMLRFYPAYTRRDDEETYLAAVRTVRGMSVVVGVVAIGLVWLLGPEGLVGPFRNLLGVAAVVYIGQALFQSGQSILRAKQRPGAYSLTAGLNSVGKLAFGLLLGVMFGMGASGLLWGTAIAPFILYAIFMHRFFGRIYLARSREQREAVGTFLTYGLPIAVTQVLAYLHLNFDRFLLQGLQDSSKVAVYSVGVQLVEQPVSLVFSTLMLAVLPAVSSIWENQGREAAEELVSALTRMFLILCVPFCIILSVLAKPIFLSMTHGEFQQGYTVVPWLAFATFCMGIRPYATFGLILANRTGLLALVTLAAVGVNIVINWFLIGHAGFLGCAMTKSFSQALLLVLGAVVSMGFLHWRVPLASFARVLAASSAGGAAALGLGAMLPINIAFVAIAFAVGLVIAYGSMLAIGELRPSELRAVVEMFPRWRK